MLDYSREAVALLRDRKRADLDRERTLGLAILRCVEIVGEAAGRVPVDIQFNNVIKISRGRKLLACAIDVINLTTTKQIGVTISLDI
jgi:uncharacterized protein with HEPN domain